jgi:putative hydrolase of the HAD superfamily
MRQDIKAVLFDVDDTLFDRSKAQSKILELIVRRFPKIFSTFEMEHIAKAFKESDRITVAEFYSGAPSDGLREKRSRLFLQILGLREDLADTITEIYVKSYAVVNAPVVGAIPLVKKLSQLFLVGIVSDGLPDVQYKKLETIGLRSLCSCIVLSEEVGIRKPDSRIFHYAASLLRIPPQDCLYVGDSYASDVIGAKKAGMLACWFNRGWLAPEKESTRADFMIRRLQELTPILLGHSHV